MKSYSILQRNKSRGSLVWYGREYEDGLLVKEKSLKTTNKREAKVWLDLMNAQRFLPDSAIRKDKYVDVVKAINAYMDMESSHVSQNFICNLKAYLGKFRRYCAENGIENLAMLTKLNAEGFYQSMEGQKESSRRTITGVVKTFVDWVIDTNDLTIKNPFVSVKMAKVAKREKAFWTDEEIEKILDAAASPVDRLFMSILAFSGLRYFEARSFNSGTIVDGMIKIIGKGDKEAFIPVSDRLNVELERTPFVDGMFKRFNTNSYTNKVVRSAVERAGLDASDATCHKFRHSFISNLARRNVEASLTSKLARHSNIATTMQFYTHFRDEDLKKAINTKKEG